MAAADGSFLRTRKRIGRPPSKILSSDPNVVRQAIEDGAVMDPNSGCWIWPLGIAPSNGYANVGEVGRGVHRISYEVYVGPIPAGLLVDHKCRTRCCVNPNHLRVVTPRINSIENSAGPTALNARKTHCVRGHPFTGENLRLSPHGKHLERRCAACARIRAAKQREKARA